MMIALFLSTAAFCSVLIAWAASSLGKRGSTEIAEVTIEEPLATKDEPVVVATKTDDPKIEPKVDPKVDPKVEPKVDPNAPPLLTGNLSTPDFERLRQEWATYYGKIPLDYSEDLGNGIRLQMEFVAPGKYFMGISEIEMETIKKNDPTATAEDFVHEFPQHEVTVTKGFYIGKFEITQEQYARLLDTNPSYFSENGKGANRIAGIETRFFPVESVSWDDVQGFVGKLNNLPKVKAEKRKYRLPHEAEWELAARAGAYGKDSKPFHFTQSQFTLFSSEANFDGQLQFGRPEAGTYIARPDEVTKRNHKSNRYFIHGFHGNVWEWCEDWYDENYYKMSPSVDPAGPKEGANRVIRGGCYSSPAAGCRTASRSYADPSDTKITIGFRVVADVPPKKN